MENSRAGTQNGSARSEQDLIAHLGMYDWPETTAALARFWSALSRRLRAAGIAAPPTLTRNPDFHSIWRDPGLILSQTCGYPYVKHFRSTLRLVATPIYDVEGCQGPNYASAIIAQRGDGRSELADYRGTRAAINGWDSQSGFSALRAVIAPLASEGRFFDEVRISGGHRNSLAMVAAGEADLAAVDAVCWSMAKHYCANDVTRLRVVGWSPSAPALPFVTAASRSDDELGLIRAALRETIDDPALAGVLKSLCFSGVEELDDNAYDRILEIENAAIAAGYPSIT